MPFGVEDEEVEPSSVEIGDEVRTGCLFHLRPDGGVDSVSRRSKQRCKKPADTGSVGLQASNQSYDQPLTTPKLLVPNNTTYQHFPSNIFLTYSMYVSVSLNTHLSTHLLDV